MVYNHLLFSENAINQEIFVDMDDKFIEKLITILGHQHLFRKKFHDFKKIFDSKPWLPNSESFSEAIIDVDSITNSSTDLSPVLSIASYPITENSPTNNHFLNISNGMVEPTIICGSENENSNNTSGE